MTDGPPAPAGDRDDGGAATDPGDGVDRGRARPRENGAQVRVALGPLVAPVVNRVIAMIATRADCPLDRLDDALLISDAVVAHCAQYLADGKLCVGVTTSGETLELRIGPLRPGGARGLLAEATLPQLGNVIEHAADAVEQRPTDDGRGELLVVRIDFGGAAAAPPAGP